MNGTRWCSQSDVERDVADHHHLVVVRLEGDGEVLGGVFVQARADLGVHAGDPLRRVQQPVAVGVLADGLEDLAHGLLDAREVHRRVDGWAVSAGHGLRTAGPSVLGHRRGATSAAWPGRPRLGGRGRRSTTGCASADASAPTSSGSTGTGTSVGSGSGAASMPVPLSSGPKISARSASSSVSFSTRASARTSRVARCVRRGSRGPGRGRRRSGGGPRRRRRRRPRASSRPRGPSRSRGTPRP